jgi:hypothetical protein
MQTNEAFFWERVSPEPNSGCWLWVGKSTVLGYGQLRDQYAHRFSYELHKGPANGLHVLHTCDMPACVNPDHLFLGTQRDNMCDMHAKGRNDKNRKGELAARAVLKVSQVLDIRNDPRSIRALGKIYGVHSSTIDAIKHRRSWKHI